MIFQNLHQILILLNKILSYRPQYLECLCYLNHIPGFLVFKKSGKDKMISITAHTLSPVTKCVRDNYASCHQ